MARKARQDTDYTTLVGEHEDSVVATVEYRLEAAVIHLRTFAVDPKFQRRGFARAMVDATVDIARRNQRNTITLCTIRETGNVPLFERLGVSRDGRSRCLMVRERRFSAVA